MTDRVVALIDMDCFYCQVETRLNPDLKGMPLAVVQYNEWKGGGIIAVNYEARDQGVKRGMRGNEAKEKCPDIVLVRVPMLREKADLSRYREGGREVVSVLCTFSDCVERASVDEAYIDLTEVVNQRIAAKPRVHCNDLENTYIVGYSTEDRNNEEERETGLSTWLSDINNTSFQDTASQRLAIGAMIVEEIRKSVLETTGFKCSAGIAHNKILAKLACGLHKPDRQTVVPLSSVPVLYKNLPAKKIRSLGGKLGDDLTERLGIKMMADLIKFSENELQKRYDSKTGSWLYNIARGFDNDPVNPRLISKSIGCQKNFYGRTALTTAKSIHLWVTKLTDELLERLNEDSLMNKRRAQLLTVSMGLDVNRRNTASSKSFPLNSYNKEKITSAALSALKKVCTEDPVTKTWSPPVTVLGLSAGKFTNETSNKIMNFFNKSREESSEVESKMPTKPATIPPVNELLVHEKIDECSEESKKINNTQSNENGSSKEDKNIENNISNGGQQLSFFEKLLLKGNSNVGKKLKIIPDLIKRDLVSEEENSRDSHSSETVTLNEKSNLDDNKDVKSHVMKNKIHHRKEDKEPPKNSTSKPCGAKSISSFFSSAAVKEKWIDPEEIFPDLSNVDDEVVRLLPLSLRKKIYESRKTAVSSLDSKMNHLHSIPVTHGSSELNTSEVRVGCNVNKIEEPAPVQQKDEVSDDDIFDNSSSNCSNNTSSEYFKCNECASDVLESEREIHLDLHLAIKLNIELNGTNKTAGTSSKVRCPPGKINFGKRKGKNDQTSSVAKKPKGIADFFKK